MLNRKMTKSSVWFYKWLCRNELRAQRVLQGIGQNQLFILFKMITAALGIYYYVSNFLDDLFFP